MMNAQHAIGVGARLERPHPFAAESPECDDRLLVADAKLGRTGAFGVLYERHHSKIYRTAFRILRNRQDAEDAVQRCFQRAFTNLTRFREDSTFLTWVTRIAINEALMLVRQRRPNKTLSEREDDGASSYSAFDLPDDRPTPEQVLAQTEVRDAVTHAISKLRHNLRIVVLLREVQGLTSAETARHLGLTVGTVKARIFHARRHLRRHLQRKLEGTRVSYSMGAGD
jgi:RNA polymerase sigma-70 factor, ECF subfamily